MGYGYRIGLKDLVTRGGHTDEMRGYRMIRKRPHDAAASAARGIGARKNDQDICRVEFVFFDIRLYGFSESVVLGICRLKNLGLDGILLEASKNTRDKTMLPA